MTETAADLNNISDIVGQPIPNNQSSQVQTPGPANGSQGAAQATQAPQEASQAEHPLLNFLDLGIDQSKIYCKSQDLPEPNTALYDNFSRPLMNRALWAYIPESSTPSSPAVCLVLGLAGMGIMYAPVFLAYQKREKEKAREERQQEKIKKDFSFENLRPGQEVKQQDPGNRPEPEPVTPEKKKVNFEIGDIEEIPEELQELNKNYEPMPGL